MTIAEEAKAIYESELRDLLEPEHRDKYVAIEPVSRRYFLGDTFMAAGLAAKEAFPNDECFLLRIGHKAAFHMGAATT